MVQQRGGFSLLRLGLVSMEDGSLLQSSFHVYQMPKAKYNSIFPSCALYYDLCIFAAFSPGLFIPHPLPLIVF